MSKAIRNNIKKNRQSQETSLEVSLEIPEFQTQIENDSALLARMLSLPVPANLDTLLICDIPNEDKTLLLCPKESLDRVFSSFINTFPDEERKVEFREQLTEKRFVLVRMI